MIFIPDEERFDYDLDPENPLPGQEELELIDDNPENYVIINKWTSTDAYKFMEDFAKQEVNDLSLKNALLDVLSRNRPFARFKDLIDRSPLREKWFEYEEKRMEDFIQKEFENDPELEVVFKEA